VSGAGIGRPLLLASIPVLVHGHVLAQAPPGDPLIVSPRPELEPIRLYGVDAALELEWRRNVDRRDNGESERDREDRLREILDLRTSGFIGHPNLLELDLGGRLWFEQRWLDQEGSDGTERVDQTLFDWDASGLFLSQSRLPFTIYSRQNTSDIDRQFGGTLENRFRETGARVNFRDPVIPTNLQIFRREIEQRDVVLGQDFDIDQDTIQADGRIELGQTQRMAWDVQYDDVEESGDLRTTQDFERFEANATHTIEFGDTQQNFLRTRLRFFDETGDRDFQQIRIDPRLRFRHSATLTSWYDYSFERNDRPQQEQRSHRPTANFQHQLFESLTTIGTLGYNRLEITTDDFESDEIFGRVDMEYLKRVPYGRLALGLDGFASHLDQSERGTPIAITDELFVFNAADMFVIEGRNIIETSLVITDVTGLIIYTEGTDYTVLGFPDRVEVRRVPGGDINPGQAVLVDYVIGPVPGGETDTFGIGGEIRYTFDEGVLQGLSLYTNVFYQDENRSIVTEDFPENDFTDLRYGLEYNFWKLYFRAEGQHRDSDLSPFDAIRLEGRYTEPLGRGSSLVFGVLFQEIDREDDGIRTTTGTLSAQWNQRFDERLRLSLLLQYQLTDDNVSIDSEAFEQQLDVSWRYRQTEVYAQIRTSIRNTDADDTSFQRFIAGIRREF
jgi:hypothetical protein